MEKNYYLRHFYDFDSQIFDDSVWQKFLANWPKQGDMTPYSDGKNRSLKDAGRFGSYLIGYKSDRDLARIPSMNRPIIIDFAKKHLRPVIEKKLCEINQKVLMIGNFIKIKESIKGVS